MNQLTITPKKQKDRKSDETFGDLLDEPAFSQFANDILNDMDYTWERINHGRYSGIQTV